MMPFPKSIICLTEYFEIFTMPFIRWRSLDVGIIWNIHDAFCNMAKLGRRYYLKNPMIPILKEIHHLADYFQKICCLLQDGEAAQSVLFKLSIETYSKINTPVNWKLQDIHDAYLKKAKLASRYNLKQSMTKLL